MFNQNHQKMKTTIVLGTWLLFATTSIAQRDHTTNPYSIRPVENKDIMWKKHYTRVMDLREKQNTPLMADGMELSKYLVAGVLSGKLTPYYNDSLTQTMDLTYFTDKMTIPGFDVPTIDSFNIEDPWFPETVTEPQTPESQFYFPGQLYIVEINEDAIFDKQESKMKYDIQSLTLYIPADLPENVRGIQEPLVSFSYKECVEYFNELGLPVWFNRQNVQEHKCFSDAFDLRLFSSYIVKVSNPENQFLQDVYGGVHEGIVASEQEKMRLMEFESELWEN